MHFKCVHWGRNKSYHLGFFCNTVLQSIHTYFPRRQATTFESETLAYLSRDWNLFSLFAK